MDWFSEPLNMLIAAAGAAVLLLIVMKLRKRGKAEDKIDPDLKRLLDRKDYGGAARLEQKNGNLDMALEYFLRAGQMERAAGVAKELGQARQAAELYEKCEDYRQADAMYREAGIMVKADEMKAKIDATEQSAPAAPDDGLLTPAEQVDQQEEEFQELVRLARDGDDESRQRAEAMGQEMAEILLAAGETRKAAEICRDAGLVDQAINLFVNLLGDPAAAAPLLAERGEHERAADLYEAAGQKERALAAWCTWSAEADDPLSKLDSVRRLGDDAVITLLDVVTEQRPPAKETLELHMRIAGAFEQAKRPDSAFRLLKRLSRIDSESKDIQQRLRQLREEVARAAKIKKGEDEERGKPEPVEQPEEPAADDAQDPGEPAGDLLELEPSSDETMDLQLDLEPSGDDTMDLQLGLESGGFDDYGNLDLDAKEDDDNLPSVVPEIHESATREVPDVSTAGKLSDLDPGGGDDADEEEAEGGGSETVMASDSMKDLVQDVARRAAEETVSVMRQEQPLVTIAGPGAAAPSPGQPRFEITLRYAHDDVAVAARKGPGVAQLQAKLQDQGGEPTADLLYQLGLAQQVAGQWDKARRAFEQVAKARPDLGDAAERAQELSDWEQNVSRSMMTAAREDGQQQQRYRLLGEIGRGGMAVVFRAQDEALGREVALKFISEEYVAQEKVLEMFQREARASAQLNHPNIVTVHDVGTLDGRAFICMELVDGRPMDDVIEEQGRLKVLETLEIIEKVLGALEYAHSKKIIHRDIKPSNIMVGDGGLVKLMDFGLAKSIADGSKTTMVAGTPNYMAPEQFTGKNINASTDIFAVGATLYEMLCGESPFNGVQRDKLPPPVNELNAKVPKVLGQLIQRSLELDQERRLSSAEIMLKPIRKILASVGTFIQRRATADTLAQIRRSSSTGNRAAAPVSPATLDDVPEEEQVRTPRDRRPTSKIKRQTMERIADASVSQDEPGGLADLASQENEVGPTGTILHGVKQKKD